MKENVVLLSHYDLDGAGVSVLSDHIWNVVARKHQGYPKIRKHLDMLIAEHGISGKNPVDTIVIADLCIEPDDLKHALANFTKVVYYDHHESSEQFPEWVKEYPNLECHFSLEYCSTALVWMDGVRNRGAKATPELNAFANTVQAYDLWKTEQTRFKYGVILNDLFWELNLWDFKKRFKDGWDGFTQQETEDAVTRSEHRKHIVETAIIEEMDSGSKVVVIKDAGAINFVSSFLEGDIFYVIPPSFVDGEPPRNVSVRLKNGDEINVNDGICKLGDNYPETIQSAGGHAAAGGITFQEDKTVNDMVDFLFEVDGEIRSAGK